MNERLTYLGYVVFKKKDGSTFSKVSFYKIPDKCVASDGYEAITIFPSEKMLEEIKKLKPMTEVDAILFFSTGKDGKSYTNLGAFQIVK